MIETKNRQVIAIINSFMGLTPSFKNKYDNMVYMSNENGHKWCLK